MRRLLVSAVTAVLLAPCSCREDKPAPQAAIEPRKLEAAIRAVETYLAADKPSEAVFVAEKLAAEAPTLMRAQEVHARALVALAMHPDLPSQDREKVFVRAADAYIQAAQLAPMNAQLQHAAGVVCDTANRHSEAVRFYELARAADLGNPQFALYLGLARARDSRNAEARTLLLEAEAAMPESPDPKAALADLAMREGDFAGARQRIQQARALAPASIELRVADARMRRMAGAPQESLELLMSLDRADRLSGACAIELAAAYDALGQLQYAAAVLDESASAAPNDWKRSLRAVKAWIRAGDPIKATISADAATLAGAPSELVRRALSAETDPHQDG